MWCMYCGNDMPEATPQNQTCPSCTRWWNFNSPETLTSERKTMNQVILTEADMDKLFADLISRIKETNNIVPNVTRIYGVPRGGIPIAYRVAGVLHLQVVSNPVFADIIVDDIVCSGETRKKTLSLAGSGANFYSLLDSSNDEGTPKWYIFPWERSLDGHDNSAEDIPTRLLQFIGEDITRDGLLDTPKRFLKAWQFFTSGYSQDPKVVLGTVFENEAKYNDMVILRDIEFYSMCEHHMVPFFGKCHIAYVPDGKVVGISKLARLVDCFARRLQIQEKLTQQIANAIEGNLKPKGVAVVMEAQHLCMVARGVEKQNSVMVTSALKGCMSEPEARAEFMSLVGKK